MRMMRGRQAKELQLQMIKNRVALLEGEEQRIRKRAINTKKKAANVFYSKVLNEDKVRDRMRMSFERAQAAEHLKLKVFH